MTNPLNEKDYVTFARRFVKETVETLDYQELKNLVTDYIHEDLQKSYDDYGTELVDNFGLYFDLEASYYEKFEDMYEGHFETGQDFAFYYVNEVDKTTKDIPNWVTIDYADIWENYLTEDYFEIDCDMSEYTYGHIFKREVK